MNELRLQQYRIIKISWVITIIGTILSLGIGYFFGDAKGYAVGFLLGAVTSMLNFNLINRLVLSLDDNERRAKVKSYTNFLLRMAIYLFILYASYVTGFNIFTTAIAFFVTKIAIIYDAYNKTRQR